jgi:transposase-like protein
MTTRRKHTASFRARVALEALEEQKTLAQISSEFQLHPTQIRRYRDQLKDGIELVFSNHQAKELQSKNELIDKLYCQIGKLNTEYEWLKKKLGFDD